jgi:hypothetical protein
VLYSDLLDDTGGISSDIRISESEAGIAYAKLKAVYPSKTRDMIAKSRPADLANEPAVRDVLGQVKVLKEKSASELYHLLQRYVDSKEKTTAGRRKADTPMEYWPLIKVVRIYTKAAALSTGAVIVDLVSLPEAMPQ